MPRPARTRPRSSSSRSWSPTSTCTISYPELLRRVNEVAARAAGLAGPEGRRPGDAAHADGPGAAGHDAGLRPARRHPLQVFGGFSGNACGTRIADSGSRVLITMDGYYRAGNLIDHKVKADEAVADAAKEGQAVDKVLVWRRHPGQYGSQTPMAAGPGRFRRRPARRAPGRGRRAGAHAGRGAAVPDVHQRHDRAAEGLPAQHRRLPVLCGRDVQVHPGHPPGRRLLVHGRHRLDHRPFLYRLRAAGPRRHLGDLRGRAELPRRWAPVADRREARGQHLPHLAHGHPAAAQGRPRGAEEVRLPLQAHDHGGRADRARGVALVPQRGRQGRGGHRRHLVADRDRRLPRQHAARPEADEAGQLRARGARRSTRSSYDEAATRSRTGRRRATSASATRGRGSSRPSGASPTGSWTTYYAKYSKDPDSKDWRDWPYFAGDGAVRPPTATTGSSAASTTSSTWPGTGSAPRRSSRPR